jgi:hypothetical protein
LLSIIIPQYKETFEFMRTLFESLDGQRLIDFSQNEALYECGSTERLNFFNECRKQVSSPIMERQTFNEFMEEICK